MSAAQWRRRTVGTEGVETAFLEAGSGEPLVLLHGGEFGSHAEAAWGRMIKPLTARYRVLAPDWVGFGGTDKLYDFVDPIGRRVRQITAFINALGLQRCHYAGHSMGAAILLKVAAEGADAWRIRTAVAISGGGVAPNNEARRAIGNYDGTRAGMRALLELLYWGDGNVPDEDIDRWWRASVQPGAWEVVAAANLARPGEDRSFQQPRIDYSAITVPVLVVGGDVDPLREPGAWERLCEAIPGAVLALLPGRHGPQLEHPAQVYAAMSEFLATVSSRVAP